ncbi:AzlC family ABC transporter permease [Oricola cellulosilytica]|uniref:Branched-chain amino acid ABC transporter permease n=1 Tax=Oricola cellulosilytica TaxID=1429082 RepID=A0A4R0PF69_9HYPH|nr:AzlC family ABC transporter permease [Oricola cellulosilytica]TCD15229.1 branched-chain amino acid ABC transporter permease [Oricola cellulosilytica]
MTVNREIRDGFRAALPVLFAAAPFGMLFGALAVDNGFTVFEAVLMSATVYAGASQMVGIDLFGDRIAPWLIVLSIFAVNFRHVLYSAVVGRQIRHWSKAQRYVGFFFLIDPQFAESEKRVESGRPLTFLWYMSAAIPVYVAWVLEGWIGAVFGKLVSDPAAYGIDFLLPIYFLGLVAGFRRRANWLPVVIVSGLVSVGAYAVVGSPWHVSIGAIAGVLAAAAIGTQPNRKPVV